MHKHTEMLIDNRTIIDETNQTMHYSADTYGTDCHIVYKIDFANQWVSAIEMWSRDNFPLCGTCEDDCNCIDWDDTDNHYYDVVEIGFPFSDLNVEGHIMRNVMETVEFGSYWNYYISKCETLSHDDAFSTLSEYLPEKELDNL